MGYTLEQLQKAGFKPEAAPAGPKRMTLEELQAMGFKAPEDPLGQFTSVDLSKPLPRKIDPRRAFVLGASQTGTLGNADEIGGLVAEVGAKPAVTVGPAFALRPTDTPQERAIKEEALGRRLEQLRPGGDPLSYEGVRDKMRAEAAKAAEDQPRYYTAGEALGGIGSGVVAGAIPVLGETKAAGSALKMLVGGPGLGAAQGLGSSNAPMGSVQSARDILLGAGLGAGGEAVGAVAGKVAPGILKRTGEALEKRGVDNARKVLTSGAHQLDSHMTSDLAPRIALTEKAIPLWGTPETAYKRLVPLADETGKQYADIIQRLRDAGVPGEKARDIATEFLELSAKDWKNSGANKSVSKRFESEAQNAENVADPFTDRMDLVQGNEIKKRLYAEAQGEYLKAGPESPLGHAKKTSASIYRRGEENAIEAGRAIPDSEYIYHVTPEANLQAIRKEGLRPDAPKIAEGGPHGDTRAVFLGEQGTVPTYEDLYGGQGLAVVRTSRHGIPGLIPDTASEGGAWMTPNAIPPERLQVRNAAGGWEDLVPGSTAKRIQDIEAFVPVKQRLGPLLEARNTAQLGMQKFQSRTSGGAAPSRLSWMATALGHPEVMAGDIASALTKNRLPGLAARTEFASGRGLQSLAGRMSTGGNTLPFTGGLGSVAARTLGMRPEPPAAPEPPPEGPEAEFQRYLLEQGLRANSQPGPGAPLRRLGAKGGAPIDRSRPIIQNPDGSFSTERTITIDADGKQIIIPTIVGGQQRTPQEAVRLWRSGANPSVGIFDTPAEAEAYAQRRSQEIGRVRAGDALRRRK